MEVALPAGFLFIACPTDRQRESEIGRQRQTDNENKKRERERVGERE